MSSVPLSQALTGQYQGTSFPASPATGTRFFRTDLGMECYYDGTRWLTSQIFTVGYSDVLSKSTNGAVGRYNADPDYQVYLVKLSVTAYVNTTNTGSAYWNLEFAWTNSANGFTTIQTNNTSANTPNTWQRYDMTLNQVLDATARKMDLTATKTGSPGNLLLNSTLYYRLVVP